MVPGTYLTLSMVGGGYLYLVIQLLGIYKAYVSNLSLLVCLEPFKKFSVGGWVGGGWVANTVNIVFCFGPRLGPKTGVLAQAEQFWTPDIDDNRGF